MNKKTAAPWKPTQIVRVFSRDIGTATSPVVVMTDKGIGYFKAVENDEGSFALAREFIGTSLATWLGLSTFNYCLFNFDGELKIILENGRLVGKGVGFMTKEEPGYYGDRTISMLNRLANKEDITRLVCFDTWIRNVDRCFKYDDKLQTNWNNVFMSVASKKQFTLKAMDFTHAFWGNLDQKMDKATNVNDEEIYGLFPEFVPFLKKDIAIKTCKKIAKIQEKTIRSYIESIPDDWNIVQDTREAWIRFVIERANFVSSTFLRLSKLDTSYFLFSSP